MAKVYLNKKCCMNHRLFVASKAIMLCDAAKQCSPSDNYAKSLSKTRKKIFTRGQLHLSASHETTTLVCYTWLRET